LDKDNDLVIVGKNTTSAVGTITHIAGRILDAKGSPVRNAEIEIWQVDGKGVYLAQANQDGADRNFQGWGKFVTNAKGEYRFRTIKPVPYPGRSAPHIHVKVTAPGGRGFTTQLFIKGHPGNMQDNIYGSIRDAAGRASVTKDFAPVKGSKIGECAVQFDIVLGATAEEQEHDNFGRRPPRGRRGGRPPGPPPGGFGETPPPGGFGRPPFD
jgi:protocatechuate 3,4-dioxygenase beta subunit